jgi:hypothetical protein
MSYLLRQQEKLLGFAMPNACEEFLDAMIEKYGGKQLFDK